MSTVNHPAHYGGEANPYEAIKVIDAWRCNFNTGNSYKYMARAGLKVPIGNTAIAAAEIDLNKARWYLAHQLNRLEAGCATARQTQPPVVPSMYAFDLVMTNVRFLPQIEPAIMACFDQCSPRKVEAGIRALDFMLTTNRTMP